MDRYKEGGETGPEWEWLLNEIDCVITRRPKVNGWINQSPIIITGQFILNTNNIN